MYFNNIILYSEFEINKHETLMYGVIFKILFYIKYYSM